MIINVPFRRQTGLFGLGADLKQDRQSGGLQTPGSSAKRRAASSGSSGVGRASSTHRGGGAAPSPEVVDAVNNLPPNVTDSQPFRKGPALQPDTIRVDAGSGEPAYNPSNPLDRLHFQVLQAGDLMRRRAAAAANLPSVAPVPVQPIVAAQTYSGGGGGGGGGGDTSASDPPAPGFWESTSTTTKVVLVGGGLLVVGLGIYALTRKGNGGGGAGPRHKS